MATELEGSGRGGEGRSFGPVAVRGSACAVDTITIRAPIL